MQLSAGQVLSFYEVLGPLGAGAMGEVYRARDTRLEREVALKVLPESLVQNEEHLARFQREAKLLASLNHPNVATIYGVDQADGMWFLALELVPGETLRDRIERGPLPVEEAIRVTRQVAAGLQAAHEAGIVHRDLKPANIMFRPDGGVKILDFGLAKQTGVGKKTGETLTQAYQVVGTPGYLSPEQARGESADPRADVWAFGCILYECLVGQRAFEGADLSETIRAIFEETPDFDRLPVQTPPTVRIVVSRCLAKDSSARLRNIGDVKLMLDGALEHSTTTSGRIAVQVPEQRRRNRWLIPSLVALLALAGVWIVFLAGRPSLGATPARETRTLALPFGLKLGWRRTSANLSKLGNGSPLLALSPNGQRTAYCATDGKTSAIYVHASGDPNAIRLSGTELGRAPFFSPDGRRVGFLAKNKLRVVSADGEGASVDVCDVSSPNFSACWTPDGSAILYSVKTGLYKVAANGREPPKLVISPRRDLSEVEYTEPCVLPDNDHVLFTVASGTKARIEMLSLETGKRDIVVPDGRSARYSRGRILYAREGGVRIAAFDPASPGELGLATPVQEGVYTTPGAGGGTAVAHFDVSANGVLAFAPATKSGTWSTAFWVERDSEGVGTRIDGIDDEAGNWKHVRLSPDGRSFAVDILDASGSKDVFVYELGRGFNQLTHDGTSTMSAFAPDGSITVRSTHWNEMREFAKVGAAPRTLFKLEGMLYADSWSPNGKTLFLTQRKGMRLSIWTFERGAKDPEKRIDRQNARYAQISPDGHWLAYVQDVRDRPEVFVQPYPALDDPVLVSTDGGGEPLWSKDGRELFYRTPDGTMLAVSCEFDPEFRPKPPQRLFKNNYDPEPWGHQHYDVSKDGRFLMIRNEPNASNRIHVVSGALTDRAPAR